MNILKAVVFWSTYIQAALIDLVFGLIYVPIIILFWAIHHFTGKAKKMYNLTIEIRYGISWPFLIILVPGYAWYKDETIEEAYLDLNQMFNERKASILI